LESGQQSIDRIFFDIEPPQEHESGQQVQGLNACLTEKKISQLFGLRK
jgi:hypothetical protein